MQRTIEIGIEVYLTLIDSEKKGSGNWVDWEDVSMGDNKSDGFEHPYFDEDGEW